MEKKLKTKVNKILKDFKETLGLKNIQSKGLVEFHIVETLDSMEELLEELQGEKDLDLEYLEKSVKYSIRLAKGPFKFTGDFKGFVRKEYGPLYNLNNELILQKTLELYIRELSKLK